MFVLRKQQLSQFDSVYYYGTDCNTTVDTNQQAVGLNHERLTVIKIRLNCHTKKNITVLSHFHTNKQWRRQDLVREGARN